ncbi:MAG: cache domain-containing protein [Anaerolineales bacterium]|nr:cache domain-containing protein [Anaerolineales bacterium]
MSRSQRLALLTGLGLILIAMTYFAAMEALTRVTEERVDGVLTTVRDTTHEGLVAWMDDIRRQVTGWAALLNITTHTQQLLDAAASDPSQLAALPAQRAVRQTLSPVSIEDHLKGYFIVSPDNLILAASDPQEIGHPSLLAQYPQYYEDLFSAKGFVSIPLEYTNSGGQTEAVILAGAPIRATYGPIQAGLVFYVDPVVDFSRILQSGRLLNSGENLCCEREWPPGE